VIIDLNRHAVKPAQRFDVCVVGAGAAGISLTIELARRGLRVALLEAGGKRFEARSQADYAGESVGLPYTGLYNGRSRVLGGTTTQWGGQVLEIDEHVFAERPGVAGGAWPFGAADLAPAYARALQLEGLHGVPPDIDALWRARGWPCPEFGAELHAAVSRWCPTTDFARLHAAALGRDPNIHVFLHAAACELRADDGGTVRLVRARNAAGVEIPFEAEAAVLAMGGIEVNRLLMQPARRGGCTPWNANALLGRHFQDHLTCMIATLRPASLPDPRYLDYFAVQGLLYQPKIKLNPEVQAAHRTLDVCGTVTPTRQGVDDLWMAYETYRMWRTRQLRTLSVARIAHFARHVPTLLWHKLPYARLAAGRTAANELRLSVQCEQSPRSAGLIELTGDRDASGLLRARIAWRTCAQELHSIRTFLAVAQRAFRARGLGEWVADSGMDHDDDELTQRFRESYHHIGGTRMALSRSDGVVDPDLRIFGTTNTYVCSSSVFPSAGFANPTHTVIALAVRLAAHLEARAHAQPQAPALTGCRSDGLSASSRAHASVPANP
jgi:choline dehydrogenase-like flavoprotein